MPERPYRATRLGTLFHSWVENRSQITGGAEEIDADPFEQDSDELPYDKEQLDALKRIFERSAWAERAPSEVEIEIHLPFEGQIVVCKIDAVYEQDGRYEIVDWKTGKAPKDADDLEQKQLQLALYRLAYSRWKGVSEDEIDAVFYFVADDKVIRPERIYSENDLRVLWSKVT